MSDAPQLVEVIPPTKDGLDIADLAKKLMKDIIKDCYESTKLPTIRVQLDIKVAAPPSDHEKLRPYMFRLNDIMSKANMEMVNMTELKEPNKEIKE